MNRKILFIIPIYLIGVIMGEKFHSAEWQISLMSEWGYGIYYSLLATIIPLIISLFALLIKKRFPVNFFLLSSYVILGIIYFGLNYSQAGLKELYFIDKYSRQTVGLQNDSGSDSEQLNPWDILMQSQELEQLVTDKYSIAYPKDWKIDQDGEYGTEFFLFPPEGIDLAHVNLVIQDLRYLDVDLDNFVDLAKAQLPIMFDNHMFVESERVTKDGDEYHKMKYSATMMDMDMSFVQHVRVVNDSAFVLTFTGVEKSFAKHLSASETIMNSFSVK